MTTEKWLTDEVQKLESHMAAKGFSEPGIHLRPQANAVLEHALKRGYTTREYHAVMEAYHRRQLQKEEALTR